MCYLSANDHASAAVMLEKFVKLTPQAERPARGHFALADAYQAQTQKAKVRAHYLKCIELNEPPYVFRALAKLRRPRSMPACSTAPARFSCRY